MNQSQESDNAAILRRPQARGVRARGQILAAAERRFADLGYAATRLEDIGADVGVGRSVVLYHFNDKQRLYRAVLDELFGGMLDVIRRALAGAGDLPTRFENGVRTAVAYVVERPAAARIAMREAISTDPRIREEIWRQGAPIVELLTLIFEEGQRAGVIRPQHPDPLHFISVISGTTIFYVAAVPNLLEVLPYDHLSAAPVEALQDDLLTVTRRLLGLRAPGPHSGTEDAR
jgi:TetR/AcrR family transcriptional regulator